jgi:hypothetical protein
VLGPSNSASLRTRERPFQEIPSWESLVSRAPISSYFSAQFLLLWLLINLTADFMIVLPTLRRSFVERDGGSPPTAELSAHLGSQDRNEQPGPLALGQIARKQTPVAAVMESGDRE